MDVKSSSMTGQTFSLSSMFFEDGDDDDDIEMDVVDTMTTDCGDRTGADPSLPSQSIGTS